jgi:uncharacterized protein (DUF885 family)
MPPVTKRPYLALLLLGAPIAVGAQAPATPTGTAPAPAASTATAAEDARLLAFLDRAFDASLALSPESMTSLGLKTHNDRLDDYSDAADARALALQEQQLAAMRRSFSPDRLGPGGKISYRLFEAQVETARKQNV